MVRLSISAVWGLLTKYVASHTGVDPFLRDRTVFSEDRIDFGQISENIRDATAPQHTSETIAPRIHHARAAFGSGGLAPTERLQGPR